MKAIATILIVLAASCRLLATEPSAQVLDAICQVESGGDSNAVGDNGKAVGAYQIHMCVIEDVNKLGYSYKAADRKDPAKAREICKIYLTHYTKKLGRAPTVEDYAGIWNGGPTGYKKKATLSYRKKVRKQHG